MSTEFYQHCDVTIGLAARRTPLVDHPSFWRVTAIRRKTRPQRVTYVKPEPHVGYLFEPARPGELEAAVVWPKTDPGVATSRLEQFAIVDLADALRDGS